MQVQNNTSLSSQLAAAQELHDRAEVQCQTLQQRMLAIESRYLASGLAAPLTVVAPLPLPVHEAQVPSPPLPQWASPRRRNRRLGQCGSGPTVSTWAETLWRWAAPGGRGGAGGACHVPRLHHLP